MGESKSAVETGVRLWEGKEERGSECGSVCTLWPGGEANLGADESDGGIYANTEQREETERQGDALVAERNEWGREIKIEIEMPKAVLLAKSGVICDVEMADLGDGSVGIGNGERMEKEPFPRAEPLGGGEGRRLV